MNRIVIIGNGFDLAHGFKTSYDDFIKYIINESISFNKEIRKELIDVGYLLSEQQTYEFIKENFAKINSISTNPHSGSLNFTNNLFRGMLATYFSADWLDIESYYFNYINKISHNEIDVANREFEVIKKYLEIYLSNQILEDGFNPMMEFYKIFEDGNPESLLLLNFNYTPTLQKYFRGIAIKSKMILNIHGELNSKKNPMIFGYGDETNPQYKSIVNKDDNRWLTNLKRQQYNLANPYEQLIQVLNQGKKTEVFVIGHSLGMSDKSLLNQILDHDSVSTIKLYYYKDRKGYRKLNDNLSRIVNSNTYNNKIVSLPNSKIIPQISNPI
ncbi:hypothetical protein JYT76_01055 [Olleya sp. AH-315-F22]|nr:hypothetical protein [Olleya sp. AH-315-F22]